MINNNNNEPEPEAYIELLQHKEDLQKQYWDLLEELESLKVIYQSKKTILETELNYLDMWAFDIEFEESSAEIKFETDIIRKILNELETSYHKKYDDIKSRFNTIDILINSLIVVEAAKL